VGRELKARYRGSILGFFWSFVNPLLQLLTYGLVFVVILPGRHDKEMEPYLLFFFCGILPWTWFNSSLLEASGVLIAGGWPDVDNSWPAPNYGDHQPLASTELYDPKTGQWSAAGGLPVAMGEPTVVPLPGGGALAFGGTNVARFEPASGTWTATSPMLSAAAHRRAVALEDGRVLVAGGDVGGAFTAEAETFDPATGSWTATAPMPAPRSGGAAIRLGDGSVLFVGGEAEPGQGDPSCAVTATQVVRFAL